jgi:membrane protein implicated in regulation of membrane protease activity
MEMNHVMAVELFVWLYIGAFAVASLIAIVLLVAAARRLGRDEEQKPDQHPFDHFEH